jgi:chromosome segregation ATPase
MEISMRREELAVLIRDVIEKEIEKVRGEIKEVNSRISSLEEKVETMGSRLERLEISSRTIEAGIIAGERERQRVRKIREIFMSSPEGFNTRRWIRTRSF